MNDYLNHKWRNFLNKRPQLLTEEKMIKTGTKQKTIALPQFRINEKWGEPGSADRKNIRIFFRQIVGKTLPQKIAYINGFINNCKEECIRGRGTSQILGNLVLLDSLASIIYEYNYATGGFLFEAFLAALYGSRAEQIPATQSKTADSGADIADILDSARNPVSLKFYKAGGSKQVGGSLRDLRHSVLKYKKPMKYLVVLKNAGDKGAVDTIDFYEFTVGTNGSRVGDQEGPLRGIRPTSQGSTDFFAEDFIKQETKASPRWEIPLGWVKDLGPVATLEFGSQQDLKDLASKYVEQLQEEVTLVYNNLDMLTTNINRYLVDNNKAAGSKAATNARELHNATQILIKKG